QPAILDHRLAARLLLGGIDQREQCRRRTRGRATAFDVGNDEQVDELLAETFELAQHSVVLEALQGFERVRGLIEHRRDTPEGPATAAPLARAKANRTATSSCGEHPWR